MNIANIFSFIPNVINFRFAWINWPCAHMLDWHALVLSLCCIYIYALWSIVIHSVWIWLWNKVENLQFQPVSWLIYILNLKMSYLFGICFLSYFFKLSAGHGFFSLHHLTVDESARNKLRLRTKQTTSFETKSKGYTGHFWPPLK